MMNQFEGVELVLTAAAGGNTLLVGLLEVSIER